MKATSFVSFEAKVFDSVNFFASLDVPAFLISNNSKLANLVIKVVEESMQDLPGKERLINIYTEQYCSRNYPLHLKEQDVCGAIGYQHLLTSKIRA